jgi:hypothetical protein
MKERSWLQGRNTQPQALAQFLVAATVPLRSLVFRAKAVDRSDWGSGPKGAVAIARHPPYGTLFGRATKATEIYG